MRIILTALAVLLSTGIAFAADPAERKNLILDQRYAADVAELSNRLLAHMKKTRDPQTGAFEAVLKSK
jgi:hypothetical protein